MSISKDVCEVNTASIISVHKIISKMLRSINDVLPAYEEILASCNDIINTAKQEPEISISMIDGTQRKMNRNKEGKYLLLYYQKLGDLIYEYKVMDTFLTKNRNKLQIK